MQKIILQVSKLATGTQQVTFDSTQKGEHAYLRLKLQCPDLDFIGHRTVNIPEGRSIESILEEFFNPDVFEVKNIKGKCISDICNQPRYADSPEGWPYICAECPYHQVEFL